MQRENRVKPQTNSCKTPRRVRKKANFVILKKHASVSVKRKDCVHKAIQDDSGEASGYTENLQKKIAERQTDLYPYVSEKSIAAKSY